ncbi:MAG TPA: hypothetical protein VLN08_00220, partial [Vicinamibacterales bacterium]|nr:hypothetical protein [Vicinamibacterales bacterium]
APEAPLRQTRLPFTTADGDRFALKYADVVARTAEGDVVRRTPIKTVVTEPEINAYLRYRGAGVLPVGVVDPYVFVLGSGRLSGVANVDLDAVRLSKPRGMLDPAQLLRGRVPVAATGVLRSKGGEFWFDLESATVAGMEVPKSVLQELVSYYTKSPSNPSGYDLDAPFSLGGGIREIAVESKRAVIIQ